MSRLSLIGVSKQDVTSEVDLSTVEGVIMHYTDRIITEAKENLVKSNASYQLSQSITVTFELRTEKFGQSYVAIVSAEDYWQYVEDGRPPGKQPPHASIVQWIRDKEGFQLKGMDRLGQPITRGIKKGQKVSLNDIVNSAAFGIARHIGQHGTQGTKFLSKVLSPDFYTQLNRDLSTALKKDIEATVGAFKLTPDGKEFTRL